MTEDDQHQQANLEQCRILEDVVREASLRPISEVEVEAEAPGVLGTDTWFTLP